MKMRFFSKKNQQAIDDLDRYFSSEFNFRSPIEQRGTLFPKTNSFIYRGVPFVYGGVHNSSFICSLSASRHYSNLINDESPSQWSSFVRGLLDKRLAFDAQTLSFSCVAWADLVKMRFFPKINQDATQEFGQESFGKLSSEEADLVYGGTGTSPLPFVTPNSGNFSEQNVDESPSNWSPSFQAFLDQPPSSFPYRLIAGGLILSVSFVTWAHLGRIDEVGKAQGRLIPEGETYKIEPIELSQVEQVFVEEGDEVQEGQLLVELDTELAEKEVERLEQMINTYQTEFTQKQSLREKVKQEVEIQVAVASAKMQAQQAVVVLAENKKTTYKQLLAQQQSDSITYRLREQQLRPVTRLAEKRLQQLQGEKVAHQKRLKKLLPLLEEGAISQEFVFQAEQALRDTEQRITFSEMQEATNAKEQLFKASQAVQNLESQMIQTNGDLLNAIKEAEGAQAELWAQQSQVQKIELEALQKMEQLDVELTQLQGKISETQNLLVSAQAKLQHKYLRAPVNGTVLSLDVQNTGQVLNPGHTVAEIAPQGAELVVSATIPNREAGFVEPGMPVQVKLDAYPYQDYGVIPGRVIDISADAEEDEQLGEVYHVSIKLEKDHISENGEIVSFKAGQTVTADIIIRNRRIIDVLLEPIKQIQEDGINL